jgi:D-beta-D-heptose 7-phosphate kinase/D-beta-D-heptose 1-phosphate adenosyltransferase
MQIPAFHAARVLVAGDIMLDRYWHGATSRISPEAPVPVVRIDDAEERVGGAGNVALNIAALGASASLIGYRGEDEAGEALTELLRQAGVQCLLETPPGARTITKLRVLSRHQQLIRLDFESGFHRMPREPFLHHFSQALESTDVVVLSDYGKGTLGDAESLIRLARLAGKTVLVDPKGSDFSRYRDASAITPNQGEFEVVAGYCEHESQLVERGLNLLADLRLDALLITRGERGMTLLHRDAAPLSLPAHAREVFDVTGAGDTVISTLAASLAAGCPWPEATHLANVAAGVVVGKLGTATVSAAELADALHGSRARHRGGVDLGALLALVEQAREAGEKIVLTNGCFDILHAGHVYYLQQARALGDRLIVLVNSDASVRRIKGVGRPVNPLEQRMTLLAALECVDWVTPFDADTPREAICRILPDILVKGGDYARISDIAGGDCVLANGGEVRLLDFVEGHSTSRLIEAIRNA